MAREANHTTPAARTPAAPDNTPAAAPAPEAEVVKPNEPEAKPEAVTAPGEARAGAETVKVKATGEFYVYDPYTTDHVSSEGGEMRLTEFVRNKLADGSLEEI